MKLVVKSKSLLCKKDSKSSVEGISNQQIQEIVEKVSDVVSVRLLKALEAHHSKLVTVVNDNAKLVSECLADVQEYISGYITQDEPAEDIPWRKMISQQVDELVELKPSIWVEHRNVYRYIYNKMTRVYGIVWAQEAKEYKRDHSGRFNTLDLIENKEQYREIFSSILKGLLYDDDNEITVSRAFLEKQELARQINSIPTLSEIVEPLAQLRNDTTTNYRGTYTAVVKRMKVDWSKYTEPNKTKKEIISKHYELILEAKRVVDMMMQMKNGGKVYREPNETARHLQTGVVSADQ